MDLGHLSTPSLLLDRAKLAANIARMNAALTGKGVAFRPHMKTAKSAEIGRLMTAGWSGAVTVSTLKEAEQFLAAGFTDILYAVGITPDKLDRAAALRAAGADLAVVLDSVAAAEAVAGHGAKFPVLIEIDSDGHRAGVSPEDHERLVAIARALADGAELRGVMTHGGGSYDARSPEALTAHATLERTGAVHAAETLRAAGFPCPVVSIGSTPTALFADSFDGVTEVRTGVYAFMDLVMAGLGVCETDDIALSVLTTVTGRQEDRGWLIVDAGWMALSRDRGTAAHILDQGYGLVCDLGGRPFDLIVISADQEHGIVAARDGGPIDMARFPIGTRLRILPNHACPTATQHDRYHVLDGGEVIAEWPRFSGW